MLTWADWAVFGLGLVFCVGVWLVAKWGERKIQRDWDEIRNSAEYETMMRRLEGGDDAEK